MADYVADMVELRSVHTVQFGPLLAYEECSGMMDESFVPRLQRRH